jgi:predicted esterase
MMQLHSLLLSCLLFFQTFFVHQKQTNTMLTYLVREPKITSNKPPLILLLHNLPISHARGSKQFLESIGMQLSYHEYEEGHTISQCMLSDFISWLP